MKNIFNRPNSQKITDERIGPMLGEALGSSPENGECPPPEDFAALSESKTAGEERNRLLLHLAGCERCRTVYSMVCEIATAEETATSADFRWQARRLVPLAAAAGLILVIVSWPLLTHRESGVNESVSPYIKKPAAIEPEKPATASPNAGGAPQEVHEDITGVAPKQETQIPAKKEMGSAPPPKVQAAPSPVMQAAQPSAPMSAKENESNDTASKAMESPKLMVSPAAKAPRPAAKGEAKPATPAGEDSNLALSRQAPEAPKQVTAFEPRFIAAPITKPAETQTETLNLHRRVEIDEGQRRRLSKADAATSDKVKIEGIFRYMKLETCGFPLQDINKVVVQWAGPPRRQEQSGVSAGARASGALPGEREKVQANISLEDGGVLTIDVQGTPSRGGKIAVGC